MTHQAVQIVLVVHPLLQDVFARCQAKDATALLHLQLQCGQPWHGTKVYMGGPSTDLEQIQHALPVCQVPDILEGTRKLAQPPFQAHETVVA